MPTSADLREGSRIAVAAARALGSKDLKRGRKLAAHGLALALRSEQMERDAVNRYTISHQRLIMARRTAARNDARQNAFELDAQI